MGETTSGQLARRADIGPEADVLVRRLHVWAGIRLRCMLLSTLKADAHCPVVLVLAIVRGGVVPVVRQVGPAADGVRKGAAACAQQRGWTPGRCRGCMAQAVG